MTPQPTTQDEKINDETPPTNTPATTTIDDDTYIPLSDEMSSEYREMLLSLGHHPDKIKINTLSMIADDHALSPPSSSTIYSLIRDPLLSPTFHPQKKLPLVYVIDSILKNVGGLYIELIANDAGRWMTAVVDGLDHPAKQLPPDCHPELIKAKLKKVWLTWSDGHLFKDDVLKDMGKCFVKDDERRKAAVEKAAAAATTGGGGTASSSAAGAAATPTTSLVDSLPVPLRHRMQIILDELTSDESELDKVSLERLSQIDEKLFAEIKKAALDALRSTTQQASGATAPAAAASNTDDDLMMGIIPSIFIETRPPEVIQRGREWELSSGWKNRMQMTNDIVSLLQKWVREGSFNVGNNNASTKKKSSEQKTDDDEEDKEGEEEEEEEDEDDDDGEDDVNRLAAAGCVANVLTLMLQKVTKMEESDEEALLSLGVGNKGGTAPGAIMMGGMMGNTKPGDGGGGHVDKTLFTTEGIGKELNKWMVGMLYERGLPFVSSADGRRFGTEGELSLHLDKLFKKAQVEKTMEKTEERGWYTSPSSWLGLSTTTPSSTNPDSTTDTTSNPNNNNADQTNNPKDANSSNDNKDPQSCTVPADENRSKCIICGIPFEMFFDQDRGEFMYSNCTEIDVMNDDVAVEDSEVMLVHETCRRGLGDVEFLTMDQVMQN